MEEHLKKILSITFAIPEEMITDSFSADSTENWNSLTHSNLVIALEQAFNVRFTTNEVIEMMNYKLIRLVIKEKIGQPTTTL